MEEREWRRRGGGVGKSGGGDISGGISLDQVGSRTTVSGCQKNFKNKSVLILILLLVVLVIENDFLL